MACFTIFFNSHVNFLSFFLSVAVTPSALTVDYSSTRITRITRSSMTRLAIEGKKRDAKVREAERNEERKRERERGRGGVGGGGACVLTKAGHAKRPRYTYTQYLSYARARANYRRFSVPFVANPIIRNETASFHSLVQTHLFILHSRARARTGE